MQIQGNPQQLDIVFGNLIKNAAEAANLRPDASDRHIWITADKTDGRYGVTIKDSGPGIKPADLPHLFENISPPKAAEGTGVGPHLSRQLIESMGGTMDVRSGDKPQGAAFRVSFPAIMTHRIELGKVVQPSWRIEIIQGDSHD